MSASARTTTAVDRRAGQPAAGRTVGVLRRFLARSELYQFLKGGRRVEPVPVELGHRRVFILPTAHGVIFGLSILLMLIGSANYALALGFALAFLLAGISITGLIHTFRNLIGLRVSTGRTDPVFAGETAQFALQVENRAHHQRYSLHALALGVDTVFDVPAKGWASPVLAIKAERRGWLAPGRITIETRYPLGLFRTWSHVRPDLKVLVYPQPVFTPLPSIRPRMIAGGNLEVTGGSDDYIGLRGYQPGDSPRHIAWKAMARSDAVVTKQFTDPGATELFLDWTLLPPRMDVESRLSHLAGWVLHAEQSGLRYGLAMPGTLIEPDAGAEHRSACLMALALYDAPPPATGGRG